MEIERQFLVTELPPLPKEYESLRQGYVAFLPEIRIREINGCRVLLTVKRGAGLVREEWETDISKDEFDSLVARLYPKTCMVEKRRYRIPLPDDWTAELHVHDGHLAGFNYVEVEFPTTETAETFRPPSWFGSEVTEDTRFTYRALVESNAMELVKKILQGGRHNGENC